MVSTDTGDGFGERWGDKPLSKLTNPFSRWCQLLLVSPEFETAPLTSGKTGSISREGRLTLFVAFIYIYFFLLAQEGRNKVGFQVWLLP